MASTWHKVSGDLLILGVFIAISITRFHGQNKVQVAPSANSDTFAVAEAGKLVRVQQREIPATNYRIAGVDLASSEDFFDQVMRVLGNTRDQATDDDPDTRDEVCYRSVAQGDTTHLVLGQGDAEHYFVLSSDGSAWSWMIPCKPSAKITRDLATSSGLHLGQTQEQVIAILGLPTSHDWNAVSGMDEMRYDLEIEKKLSAEELVPYLKDVLKDNPKADPRAWVKNYGSYNLWVEVNARFRNDRLTSLKMLWSNAAIPAS